MLKPSYFHKGFHFYEKSVNELKSTTLLVSVDLRNTQVNCSDQDKYPLPFAWHSTDPQYFDIHPII